MNDKHVILKTLVGSQAHGLAKEDSDFDYRGVYVLPTYEILLVFNKLHENIHKYRANSWFEGKEDNTLYEVGHFLQLAVNCNPSILEVMVAPVVETDGHPCDISQGERLRNLFPFIWNPKDAYNAFIGYSFNQRTKMLDKKDKRPHKFAIAYLRTLYNLNDLLTTDRFSLEVRDQSFKNMLIDIRDRYEDKGELDCGQVINTAEGLIKKATSSLDRCKQKPNLQIVRTFLLQVRNTF